MLRKQPHRILVNALTADTVTNAVAGAAGSVDIEGYGTIERANVFESYKRCSTAETPQVDNVEVVIPTSCECPYEWSLRIVCKPDLGIYETQTTFPAERNYSYEDPAGGTPTATDAAAAIVASINADPYACVTAVQATDIAGTPGAGAFIHITANAGTNGFETYTNSGNITLVTPFVPAVLSAEDMHRLFPIQHGSFGQLHPNIPAPGATYCAYHFKLKLASVLQDDSLADGYMDYEQEVIFYVNNTLATFDADWDDDVEAIISDNSGGTCPAPC